jgi:putative transposase
MKTAGIQSKMAKRFVITANSKNTTAPGPDRLKREFRVSQINKVWVAGTTLVTDALTMSLSRRDKAKDVIVHSDHGSTYASGD